MVRSRPVYVIEALPHPGYQPVDRNSKLFTQVRARLWIDKADFRWARIEAELLDTISFGWFLLRIHPGSRVVLTQAREAGGAWLPERTWYRVSFRVGLIKSSREESETLYSHFVLEDGIRTRPPAHNLESAALRAPKSGASLGLLVPKYYYSPNDWLKDGLDFMARTRRQLRGK